MNERIGRDGLRRDLRAFAERLGRTPTSRELNASGPHYAKLYEAEFGSWNEALEAAGFEPNLVRGISREDVVADIERVAGLLGKTPTLTELDRHGSYGKRTYQRKLDSYVETLERLGLQPSVTQYNFSGREKPPELRGTENVRKLRDDGPTPASELPQNSTGATDKRYGLTKFSINTGRTGRGRSEVVYYLFEEHAPESVIRRFIETNPQLVENRTRKAIVEDAGHYGTAWSDAARSVLDELGAE